MKLTTMAAVLALAGTTACAGVIGGGKPLSYRALALDVPAGVSGDSVAHLVRAAAGDLVLLASPADSAWFTAAARGAKLQLSGPTELPGLRLGFLAMKPVGDTTLTLPVENGPALLMHDALYQPRKKQSVDLMMVRMDTNTPARFAAHALLTYVAANVSQGAAVVMGLVAPTPAAADSVAQLIRPIFMDVRDCAGETAAAVAAAPVRVLYGPDTIIRCDQARALAGAGRPVFAHFIIGEQP